MITLQKNPLSGAQEQEFYRRNAGGPVTMTSMTCGRGVVAGIVGDYDQHLATRRSYLWALELDASFKRRIAEGRWP